MGGAIEGVLWSWEEALPSRVDEALGAKLEKVGGGWREEKDDLAPFAAECCMKEGRG